VVYGFRLRAAAASQGTSWRRPWSFPAPGARTPRRRQKIPPATSACLSHNQAGRSYPGVGIQSGEWILTRHSVILGRLSRHGPIFRPCRRQTEIRNCEIPGTV
jgi:hypothetical protein